MPTPAHTDFDSANPQGSQTPTAFATSALNNDRAGRDMIIAGLVPGFVQSRTNGTGTANQPQYVTWYNSALGIGFRWNITWTTFQATSVQEEWTNDSGGSWTAVGSPMVLTYDGSDNITASTIHGGFVGLIFELWAKVLRGVSGLAAHIAGTGTAVHGLGSVSTQSASAIAFTGGAVDAVTVGLTTPALARFLRVLEAFVDLGAIAAAGTATMNLATASHFAMTPSTTTSDTMTIAVSNPPAAGQTQGFMFEIINGRRSADAKITWPAAFKWVGGSGTRPLDTALELSGRNLFSAVTRDGGTTYDVQHLGKRG